MAASIEELHRISSTPIEPGLVIVLVELERLWDINRAKFTILHDWLFDELGEPRWGIYVGECFGDGDEDPVDLEKEGLTFTVPQRYLDVLKTGLNKFYSLIIQ